MARRDPKKARLRVDPPPSMPDGSPGARRSSLLWCVKNRMEEDTPLTAAARAAGVTPQTFYIWLKDAKRDYSFPVPSLHVRPLARFFGVRPYFLRPDLYDASWEEPAPAKRRKLI